MKRRWLYLLLVFLPLIVIGFFVAAYFVEQARAYDVIWYEYGWDYAPLEIEGIEMTVTDSQPMRCSDSEVNIQFTNNMEYFIHGIYWIEKNVDGRWLRWRYRQGPDETAIFVNKEDGLMLEGYMTDTDDMPFDEFLPEREPGEYRVVYAADVNLGNQGNPHKSVNGYKSVRGCLFAQFTLE